MGLPLALAFGKYFNTIGYDIDKDRIKSLKQNIDKNNETKKIDFKNQKIFILPMIIIKLVYLIFIVITCSYSNI